MSTVIPGYKYQADTNSSALAGYGTPEAETVLESEFGRTYIEEPEDEFAAAGGTVVDTTLLRKSALDGIEELGVSPGLGAYYARPYMPPQQPKKDVVEQYAEADGVDIEALKLRTALPPVVFDEDDLRVVGTQKEGYDQFVADAELGNLFSNPTAPVDQDAAKIELRKRSREQEREANKAVEYDPLLVAVERQITKWKREQASKFEAFSDHVRGMMDIGDALAAEQRMKATQRHELQQRAKAEMRYTYSKYKNVPVECRQDVWFIRDGRICTDKVAAFRSVTYPTVDAWLVRTAGLRPNVPKFWDDAPEIATDKYRIVKEDYFTSRAALLVSLGLEDTIDLSDSTSA